MTYRREIDGLRTIAVLSVLFFHAEFQGFSGGFIGVDVFFVISGYLITSVILRDISVDKFTFTKFYEKRVRRIFPALLFISLCCVPFALFLMTPLDLKHFFQSLVGSTIFGSNVLFWLQSGDYFDTASIWKPLHHTWSLAVEEQFYVFHPIIILLASRFSQKFQKGIILVGIILSISYSLYFINFNPKGNFYLLPSRIWELYSGALLAYFNFDKIKSYFSNRLCDIFTILGLILIFYSLLTFNSLTPHPSLLTIIPVFGTILIIIFSGDTGFSGSILTNKKIVYLGLISYSLYLWHYPIFVFSRLILPNDLTSLNYIFLIFISFIFSAITYKYVEQPFRNKNKFKRRFIFKFFLIFSTFCIIIGFIGHLTNGFKNMFTNPKNANLILVQSTAMEDLDGCHGSKPEDNCRIGNKSKTTPSWALIGDSHAGSLSSELSRELSKNNLSGIQLTQGGCGYVLGLNKSFTDPTFCENLNKRIEKIILNNEIKNIVISARYVRYLFKTGYDNGEGGKESDFEDTYYYPDNYNGNNERMNIILEAYKNSIENLLKADKNVFLVYPVPEIGWDVVRQTYKPFNKNNITISYQSYLKRSKSVIDKFDELLLYNNFFKIDPSKLFCNITSPDRCETSINNKLIYFDDDHVSNDGAKLIINEILNNN